ncbi:MAG: Fpg/Nei family DNA glycosylase [Chitinivibrionales bacterium]
MPELPDVHAFKEVFDNVALHKRVQDLEINNAKVVQGLNGKKLKSHLQGKTFVGSERRGKYLLVTLDSDEVLAFHFGMTGYLYGRNGEPDRYRRVTFLLDDNRYLEYVSKRMLGRLSLSDSIEHFVEEKGLGPDALYCTEEQFTSRISASSNSIKSALMDQSRIAGLGNIYSDEVLYQAHLHPAVQADSLSDKQRKSLFRVMRRVLDVAIRHHANPTEMPDGYLLRHRKKGEKCPKCGGRIQKDTISGRSSYYCDFCQKKQGGKN